MKWTSKDIPDLKGITAIVTGANSGIGFETAKALACKGAGVIMACRSMQKGKEATGVITRYYPEAIIEVMTLDLSSIDSIKKFSGIVNKKKSKIDILVNNAGVMIPPYGKTEDGFELQFGTNHLGHFVLTGQLFDLISKADNARIVTVSSIAHRQGKLDFENLNAEKGYSKSAAYGLSKIANLMFTYELQRKIDAAGLNMIAIAAHPGWTATNLQKYSALFRAMNPLFAQKPEIGALPSLYAATAPGVKGGCYYGPGGFYETRGYPKQVSSAKRSHDVEMAGKLWEVSEEMTGVPFTF